MFVSRIFYQNKNLICYCR